jgi:hypothetical protein
MGQVTRTPAQAAEHEQIEVRNDPEENGKHGCINTNSA